MVSLIRCSIFSADHFPEVPLRLVSAADTREVQCPPTDDLRRCRCTEEDLGHHTDEAHRRTEDIRLRRTGF